jgi:hypothetical protein
LEVDDLVQEAIEAHKNDEMVEVRSTENLATVTSAATGQ